MQFVSYGSLKKSDGFKSGNRGGHATASPYPIKTCKPRNSLNKQNPNVILLLKRHDFSDITW